MRIICFADLRLPFQAAAAKELLETCHALAERGHDVTLVGRADTQAPPRDPFTFHGLVSTERLRFESAPETAGDRSVRAAFVEFAAERGMQRDADALYTRDLGIAARLLHTRRLLRPPLLYDSPGYAPTAAAALPNPPDAAVMRVLETREAEIWRGAEAYIGHTVDLVADMTKRYGRRRYVTVMSHEGRPDAGARSAREYHAERIESLLRQVIGG